VVCFSLKLSKPPVTHDQASTRPSTSAQSVIVTGDFDQWSRSQPLSRSPTNNRFMGTIKVPYGCPTRYKFIVDGEWKFRQEEPTELSPEGYVNNIYYVPLNEPLERLVMPKPSTGENGTLAPPENGNAAAKDTGNDTSNASTRQAEATIAVHETVRKAIYFIQSLTLSITNQINFAPTFLYTFCTALTNTRLSENLHSNPHPSPQTSSPPMDNKPMDEPVPAASESTTFPTDDAGANPESNVTESPDVALAPIIPITIVPVNAKENCTIDPTKVVSNEDNIGTFVGVRLPPKGGDKKMDEEEKEEGKAIDIAELPVASPSVTEAPVEHPTEEAAKEEQMSAAIPVEEKTVVPAPEPATAVKIEGDAPQTNKPDEEPKKEEDEPKKEEEKPQQPEAESSSATPTPDNNNNTQSTPKSPSRFVEGANTNTDANGHAPTTSGTSTSVNPTSSPTISSTAPGTTLAESMTSGSSPTPGNKTMPVPEQKSAAATSTTNPGGVNNGDTKEFGVKEGKSSMKSGKKKRTNSIMGTLKRIFHGDKHKKANNGSS
jgi:hypothetical protein